MGASQFAPHPFDGGVQFKPQTWDIAAAHMASLAPFELLLYPS